MIRFPSAPILIGLALSLAPFAGGEPALVRSVIGRTSARVNTSLPAGTTFTTAAKSKSELASPRGVMRVGENAELQTLPNGLALRRGVTLVASAPAGLRKTIEVRAPGYRLKVKGTAQIAFRPGRSLKVVALEGSVTVALDSVLGEFEQLQPGQMLIINPSDHRLPEPVEIDVQRLFSTSALAGGEFGELSTASKIRAVATSQGGAYERGDLQLTALTLRGVENALELQKSGLARRETQHVADTSPISVSDRFEISLYSLPNDLDDPKDAPRERTYVFPTLLSKADTVGSIEFKSDANNPGKTTILKVLLVPQRDAGGRADRSPQISGTVTADEKFFVGSPKTLKFVTEEFTPAPFGRLHVAQDAEITTPAKIGLKFDARFGLDIEKARLTAGTGLAASEVLSLEAANGGIAVTNGSSLTGGRVSIQAKTPGNQTLVDGKSKVTAEGKLVIGDRFSPTGITIRNSSELKSLAANLELLANRADITIDSLPLDPKTMLTAEKDLLIDAFIKAKDKDGNLVTTPGVVTLRNAQLMAHAIRVRAFSPGGDALIVDGATFQAAQIIKLYAEGFSTLRFRNAVSLDTPLAVLAGKTVIVERDSTVVISGKARVFTDNPHFNSPGLVTSPDHGSIHAGKGLTLKGFADAEPFKR